MSEELLSRIGEYSVNPNHELKEKILYALSNITYAQLQEVFDGALHSKGGLHADLAGPLTDEMNRRKFGAHSV